MQNRIEGVTGCTGSYAAMNPWMEGNGRQALCTVLGCCVATTTQLASHRKPCQSLDLARVETGLCEHLEQS